MSAANPEAVAAYRSPVAAREAYALRFTAVTFILALVLQRFDITIGSSFLSVVGPVGLMLAALGLLQHGLVISRARLMVFVGLLAWIMIGGTLQSAFPDSFGTTMSWLSLFQFIALSSFGLLTFAEPVDERRFFSVINLIFLVLAIAGIGQFVLQFVGLKLFSFKGLVPANMLLEGAYNTVIPIGTGGYLKSNGLVLVEPSVFSQFMALAIIVEMLMFRRPFYIASFAGGLMCSISGTGWIMIMSFVLTAGFSLGVRGLILSFVTTAIGFLAIAALAVAFPAGFDFFLSRTHEIYQIGSSGYDRFITPWKLAGFVLSRAPWTALYGLGAGVSEHLAMQPNWVYNLNPPVKISLEFGIPGFLLYLLFLLTARRTSTQNALLVPVLVLLLLDGGYSQFPPVLFPALILILLADLRPDKAR